MTRSLRAIPTQEAEGPLPAEVTRFWEARGEERPGERRACREHWNNIRGLGEAVRKALHGKVDLSRVDQETAARLYACVVFEYFTPALTERMPSWSKLVLLREVVVWLQQLGGAVDMLEVRG